MIFYNIGMNFPNVFHWIPNMKSVFRGQKKSQTRPSIFLWYFQYRDKHSQLFMLNSQHEISILGTKKSQTRPKVFPWYLPTLGWTFPMYDINFPTSFMKLYFPMKFQKPPKHTPALGNKFPWLGYELGNFLKIPN